MADLPDLASLARTLPIDALPDFLGHLATAQGLAFSRLVTPPPTAQPDSLITIEEGAPLLGMSPKFVYEHQNELPFVRKMGRRNIRLSTLGIQNYLRRAAR